MDEKLLLIMMFQFVRWLLHFPFKTDLHAILRYDLDFQIFILPALWFIQPCCYLTYNSLTCICVHVCWWPVFTGIAQGFTLVARSFAGTGAWRRCEMEVNWWSKNKRYARCNKKRLHNEKPEAFEPKEILDVLDASAYSLCTNKQWFGLAGNGCKNITYCEREIM